MLRYLTSNELKMLNKQIKSKLLEVKKKRIDDSIKMAFKYLNVLRGIQMDKQSK